VFEINLSACPEGDRKRKYITIAREGAINTRYENPRTLKLGFTTACEKNVHDPLLLAAAYLL